MSGDDYVEIVRQTGLSEGNRQWAEWLRSHNLNESDFQGDEFRQEVGSTHSLGSFTIVRVRRSALQRLLPEEYGKKVIRLPPQR